MQLKLNYALSNIAQETENLKVMHAIHDKFGTDGTHLKNIFCTHSMCFTFAVKCADHNCARY